LLEPQHSLSIDQEEVLLEDLEPHQEDLEALLEAFPIMKVVPLTSELEVVPVTWRRTFQESQEMITPSLLRCPTPPSFVTVRLKEDTIQIQRQSAKSSISVVVMEMVVLPSTASSVPTEPCSTSNTLSVTGGSMLIAPLLNSSTLSMIK